MKTFSSFVKWAFVAALVIVVNLFLYYVIASVYHEPKFENFCPVQPVNYATAESCVQAGGQWTNNMLAPAEITKAVKEGQALGYCDPNFTCQKQFNDAHSVYNRNVFMVLVIIGVIILGIGLFLPIEVLSMGFAWAGVISLIVATIRYWSDANNLAKVIILALALGALIWLAVKKMKVQE
jgi:hypothetical protein